MAEAAVAETTQSGKNALAEDLADRDAAKLKAIFDSLPAEFRTRVKRITPREMAGHVDTIENEVVDYEYAKAHWGGGKYQCQITRPNSEGRFVFGKGYTLEISGRPKEEPLAPSADPAVKLLERQLDAADARAERAERRGEYSRNSSPDYIRSITDPLIEQNKALTRQLDDMRQQLADALNREPPRDEFKDKLLDKMVDSDNARVQQIREAHESELRTIRERYEAQIERLRSSHESEVKSIYERQKEDTRDLKRGYERQIDQMERGYQSQIDNLKTTAQVQLTSGTGALESRIEVIKGQNEDLRGQLAKAQARIEALEAKKEKTIPEQAAELAQTAESFKSLGLVKSEDEGGGGKWYERLISAAAESPQIMDVIGRIAGAPGGGGETHQVAPSAEQQTQMIMQQPADSGPPIGVPFQAPDGKIYMRTGPGPEDYKEVDLAQIRRERARKRREGGGTDKPQVQVRPPDDDELKMAIKFLEGAMKANTDPAAVAQSAKSMVPRSILGYIQQVGIDDFLNRVALLSPGSPLTDQVGRKYARDVSKALLGG